MAEALVKYDIKDGIALMTLNAPDKLNALSLDMLDEMIRVLDIIAADDSVRVFVMTGAGRGFCAGADLSGDGPGEERQQNMTRGDKVRKDMTEKFNPAIKRILDLQVPTICAVNGVAAGGGYGVALSCDLVIAAESAKFILVFTPQLGLIPDLGASWHPPRVMGRARAMASAFFGDKMSAKDAVDEGLIWKCVPGETLMDEAMAVAETLKKGPTKAYPAVRKAFDAAYSQTLHEQLDMERDIQPDLIDSDDFIEGVKAFAQKRKPEFKGQ